jgi:hypothetical protein
MRGALEDSEVAPVSAKGDAHTEYELSDGQRRYRFVHTRSGPTELIPMILNSYSIETIPARFVYSLSLAPDGMPTVVGTIDFDAYGSLADRSRTIRFSERQGRRSFGRGPVTYVLVTRETFRTGWPGAVTRSQKVRPSQIPRFAIQEGEASFADVRDAIATLFERFGDWGTLYLRPSEHRS